jgi:hypothetical protein
MSAEDPFKGKNPAEQVAEDLKTLVNEMIPPAGEGKASYAIYEVVMHPEAEEGPYSAPHITFTHGEDFYEFTIQPRDNDTERVFRVDASGKIWQGTRLGGAGKLNKGKPEMLKKELERIAFFRSRGYLKLFNRDKS